jgi:hypothetical protein
MATTLRVLGERPSTIPAGWEVWNAPRPLFGSLCWEGEFRRGVHYAAIDPADEWATRWARRNEQLDGWRLEWLPRETTLRAYAAELAAREGYPLEELLADLDMVAESWRVTRSVAREG